MPFAARFVLKALNRLSVGCLTLRMPDGTERVFGSKGAGPQVRLDVTDPRFFRKVLLDGDIGFAEAYMDGYCDSPNLAALIALLAENEKALGSVAHTNSLHNLVLRLLHRWHDNSRSGSKIGRAHV